MYPDNIYHFIILTILLLLLSSYILIGFVIFLRIINKYRIKQRTLFLNKWESFIFSYLENENDPKELINKIPKRKYRYLLEYLKEFLLLLRGEDFNKLTSLINQTVLSDYLLKKLNSNNKKNIIFSSFFAGVTGIEKAEHLLKEKIKIHNQQIFFNCSVALAKINSYSSLGLILHEFIKYNNLGSDYLLLILTEYNDKVCDEMLKIMVEEKSISLLTTFLRVLRYYKYKEAGPSVLQIIVYTHSKEIILECLKFFDEIRYEPATSAVSRLLEHKLPEIRSQAIKTICRLDNKSFEEKIFNKLLDDVYDVQYQAGLAMLNYYEDGESRLAELAYSTQQGNSSAISRMLLSEKKVREGK